MNFRKLITRLSCATACILGAPANASIATYHIAGAFDSGAFVDGTFVYNNATKQVTSFLINVGQAPEDGFCDGWYCDGFAPEQTYSSAAGDVGRLNGNRWISFTKSYDLSYTDMWGDEQTTQANDMFTLGFGNYVNCDSYCPSTIGALTAAQLRVDLEENRTFISADNGALMSAGRPGTQLGYYATLVSLVDPVPPVVTPPSRPALVPEPGTLALMAAGVGLLGFARRRRA